MDQKKAEVATLHWIKYFSEQGKNYQKEKEIIHNDSVQFSRHIKGPILNRHKI